jgi:hypothetical protein
VSLRDASGNPVVVTRDQSWEHFGLRTAAQLAATTSVCRKALSSFGKMGMTAEQRRVVLAIRLAGSLRDSGSGLSPDGARHGRVAGRAFAVVALERAAALPYYALRLIPRVRARRVGLRLGRAQLASPIQGMRSGMNSSDCGSP